MIQDTYNYHKYPCSYLTSQWPGSRVVNVLDSDAVQIAVATQMGNSLRQTVHTHRACSLTKQRNW